MSPPSVWYVFPRMNLGGAEKHVLRLASRLRERGFQTGIATVFQEGDLAAMVRREGIPFVCLGEKGEWDAGTLVRIFQWMHRTRIDILHTYLFGFHFFAGLSARLLKVPVVLSSRREIALWQKKRHRWLENLGNLTVDRVVCCSKAAEQWTLKQEIIPQEKVVTIHNGVDLSVFGGRSGASKIRAEFGIPSGDAVVGTVANFSEEKGYPYLLDACQRIHETQPDTWFLFVGSGRLQEEVKEKASKISAGRRIIFPGRRSDIPDLLSAMDVFVLPSVIEGFPNVLLEAMAMARPVVATRVGGIPELVDSGRDGVLVPARDGVALADAVTALLSDKDSALRMGERASEKIKRNFSLDRMVDDYEKLYRRLLGERVPSLKREEPREKLCAA